MPWGRRQGVLVHHTFQHTSTLKWKMAVLVSACKFEEIFRTINKSLNLPQKCSHARTLHYFSIFRKVWLNVQVYAGPCFKYQRATLNGSGWNPALYATPWAWNFLSFFRLSHVIPSKEPNHIKPAVILAGIPKNLKCVATPIQVSGTALPWFGGGSLTMEIF